LQSFRLQGEAMNNNNWYLHNFVLFFTALNTSQKSFMPHKPTKCTLYKLMFYFSFDVFYVFRTSWVHHQKTMCRRSFCTVCFSCSYVISLNRRVAGSIPAGVSGFFIDIKCFRSHYGPGVDSASNRNEYQEYFLG